MVTPRRSVNARADRWLRRYTGPWRTDEHHLSPLSVEHRYRYRPRVEFVRLWFAWRDLAREIVRPFGRFLRVRR